MVIAVLQPNDLKNLSDQDFIEAIYKHCYGFMRHKILLVTQDKSALQDLIQDTIVRLIPKLPLLRSLNVLQVATYAGNTAKYIALEYMRKKRRFHHWHYYTEEWQLNNLKADNGDSLEQCYINKECLAEWEGVLANLTEFERDFLYFLFQLELTPRQICKKMGFPERLFEQVSQEIQSKVYRLYKDGRDCDG